jgi:hypothetical protein
VTLTPNPEGAKVEQASAVEEVRKLLDGGLSVADAALPRTAPAGLHQLDLVE